MSTVALETPLVFDCAGQSLLGILHPAQDTHARRGVLLVVGGPQYRVGSHRQFLLLARELAVSGTPVLRFDYRGMGDSGGELQDFAALGDDISAAIDHFQQALPALDQVVIWGLCDAAPAACFYGWRDRRVKGLVLLNPWVRTEAGEARTVLRHYYLRRLMSRNFWRKLFGGGVKLGKSVGEMRELRRRANRGKEQEPDGLDLPGRMQHGLASFDGPVLLILSGQDLVAQEFLDHVAAQPAWQQWLQHPQLTRQDLTASDHTFSRKVWRDQVSTWTQEWLRSW